MPAPSAYDFSPLASLLLVGGLLALGPVVWVRWRQAGVGQVHRLQALRIFTLWLTFDLILFGAFTRLTDSGLGCPDWPGCYGNTSPVGAGQAIAAAQAAMPSGPVTQVKAWIEMLHRYLATGVGALIVVMTVSEWLAARRAAKSGEVAPIKALSPWWATATLLWVCLQGAFGAWTVTWKLFPAIVTLHLVGALVLLALLCVQVVRGELAWLPTELPASVRCGALWVAGLLALQIVLGAWVSTNYAVLACNDFPQCQSRWWPEMNFTQGFELWRHLGMTAAGEPISFAALTAIHYVHRLMAYLVLVTLAVLAWQLNRRSGWRLASRVLAALVGLQLATGLSNVLLGWPLLAALLHTGGAAALVLALTWIWSNASDRSTAPSHVPGARRLPACNASDSGSMA
jgi:cytochrome c oxidase assembly protein subunit 15